MQDDKTLESYLNDINNSIEEMQKLQNDKIDEKDIPSNFKILMSGISDSKALDFLFSTGLDKLIDKLFELINTGNFESFENALKELNKIFEKIGLGEGSFEGPVSKTIIRNIESSVSSINFNKTKNNIKKCLLVIKKLKQQARHIEDKEVKRKYLESVYALKRVLILVAKVYKARLLIDAKVKRGLRNIIKESYNQVEE